MRNIVIVISPTNIPRHTAKWLLVFRGLVVKKSYVFMILAVRITDINTITMTPRRRIIANIPKARRPFPIN